MQTKAEALQELRVMFRNVLAASEAGGRMDRLGRARGCVDGYMRALMDLGIATRQELLDLVAVEREKANGPAVRSLDASPDETIAA